MNFTFWLLLGELLFVLLIVLIFLAIANWRKRRWLIAELADLSARVNRTEPERQSRLQQRLLELLGLEEHEAESLSRELVRAERTLFRTFTEIQFGADAGKIGAFDQSVYTLLESYWIVAAIEPTRKRSASIKMAGPGAGPEFGEEFAVEVDGIADSSEFLSAKLAYAQEPTESGDYIETGDAGDDLSEPTWDDAFDEAVEQQKQIS